MSPKKRVFFSFLLNNSLSKGQIRPKYLLHNTISPCAQTRRIKDIGVVLRKYYGLMAGIQREKREPNYVSAVTKGGIIYGNNIFDSRKSKSILSNVL